MPPRGATLNRTHPLAKGLIFAWIANAQSGSGLWDHVGRQFISHVDPPYEWKDGAFLHDNDLNRYVRHYVPNKKDNVLWNAIMDANFTVAWGFYRSWETLGSSPFTDVNFENNLRQTGQAYYDHFFYRDLTNVWTIGRYAFRSTGWQPLGNMPDADLAYYQDHITTDVCEWDAYRREAYLDGYLLGSNDARPAQKMDPIYDWNWYSFLRNDTLVPHIPVYFIYHWDRGISEAEVKLLNADPYGMFETTQAAPAGILDWDYTEYLELTSEFASQINLDSPYDLEVEP